MLRSRFGIGRVSCAAVVGLTASACGGALTEEGSASALFTTPTAASTAAGVAESPSRTLAREVTTYTLVNGTFSIMTDHGQVTGIYSGVVAVPTSGRPMVTMTLTITGGTKTFAGATGTLIGDGKGAFLSEGSFVLSLEGVVRTSAVPSGTTLRTTMKGTATLAEACRNDRILSRLRGDGTIPTVGRARVELESEIVETECFEDQTAHAGRHGHA